MIKAFISVDQESTTRNDDKEGSESCDDCFKPPIKSQQTHTTTTTATAPLTETLSIDDRAKALYHGEALGPMVRASTIPLRSLAYKYGADFAYTEELIDRSLSSTQRVVNTELGTIDYIKFDPHNHTRITTTRRKVSKGHDSLLILRIDPALERHRLVCQIGTGNAQLALQAAINVHQDVAAIDINMGCPKKFSTGGGMGSALLQDPDRACEIIRTISNTLSTVSYTGTVDTGSCDRGCNATDSVITTPSIYSDQQPKPVSAKIRLLSTVQGTIDFITALVNAGVHAIAIHGRHVGNPDVENAYWDELYAVTTMVTKKFPHVQFLINGDFYTRYEFTKFMQYSGVAGVLLARPALYNTSIFIKPPVPSNAEAIKDTVHDTSCSADCMIPLTSQSVLYGYDSPLLLDKTRVVREYLQEAIRYDGHYKNVKYVICEMMNLRRAPHARVPYLNQIHRNDVASSGVPTIGTTCAQNSIEELCQIWNVNYQQHSHRRTSLSALPDERTYSDSYLLQQQEQQPKQQVSHIEKLPKRESSEIDGDQGR
jgi:tRNA-dihydrouridine synthase 2